MKKEVKENLYLGDRTGDSLQKSTFTNPFVIAARNKKNLVLRTSDIDPDTSGITNEWTLDTAGNLTLPAGGTITEGGGFTGAIRLTPAGGVNEYQALVIYPTAGEGDHIHLTAGGGTTELYLGDDLHYVKLASDGNVIIQADNGVNGAAWTFDTAGHLTLPVGGDILDENGDSVLTTIAGDPRLTIHGYLDGVTVPGTAKNFVTFTTGDDPISALYLTKYISVDNRAWFAIQVGSTWTASQTGITADHVAYGHFGPNAVIVNALGVNLLATTGYTLLPETSYTMWIQQINAICEYAFSTSVNDQGGNVYKTYSSSPSAPTVENFYTSIGNGPAVLAENSILANTQLEGITIHGQLAEAIRTKTGAGLTVVHDFKTSSTWYHSTISQDFTPNFTNIPTDNDRVIPLKLIVANGATPYKPLSPIKIAGIDVAVTWEGGVYPTGTANLTTVWTYNLVRNAGTWKVFGKAELYTASTDVGSRAYTHSPTFTGIPAAPTALKATDTTQIATTAYVKANLLDYSPIASPTFTGTVTIPSGASISGFAPLASPTFTGTVTIPSGASISGFAPLASPTLTGIISLSGNTASTVYTDGTLVVTGGVGIGGALRTNALHYDSKGEIRSLPQNAQSSGYTLVLADAGKHISITTGGVTVPAGVFAIGDSITIYNNSASNQTITTSAVTCYLVGTATTGARTLAQRGLATLICVATNTFVITGGGLT